MLCVTEKICSAFWKATHHKIKYVTNVQVIVVIKHEILLLSGYIYIISCSDIIRSKRLGIMLLVV